MPAIKGEKILCLGITEPDAGSDVKGIKTRAVKDGDEYVINGSKTYITNGHRADVIVLVTKTDPDAGYDGFTLFLVPMDAPGVIREKKLEKLGMHASDTALLAFQDVRVPASAVLGQVGKGFYHIMWELQGERLIGAAGLRGGRAEVLRAHARSTPRSARRSASDRQLPGDPPQVRRDGDQNRVRPPDGLHDRLALRQRRVPGARDLDGQAARLARRLRSRRRVHPDPRRRRLHEGVRRRARVARHAPEPHRRGHRRDHARGDRPSYGLRARRGARRDVAEATPPFTDEHEELRESIRGLHRPRAGAARAESGRTSAGSPTRCSQARRAGPARAEVPDRATAGRAATTCTRRCSSRSSRGSARAAPPPGSARTSTSPRRRSGSSAPRSRSSATSCPRSAARRSARSASPSPAPARTSRPSARAPSAWTAAGSSTARRPTSPTACARTSSSPP